MNRNTFEPTGTRFEHLFDIVPAKGGRSLDVLQLLVPASTNRTPRLIEIVPALPGALLICCVHLGICSYKSITVNCVMEIETRRAVIQKNILTQGNSE